MLLSLCFGSLFICLWYHQAPEFQCKQLLNSDFDWTGVRCFGSEWVRPMGRTNATHPANREVFSLAWVPNQPCIQPVLRGPKRLSHRYFDHLTDFRLAYSNWSTCVFYWKMGSVDLIAFAIFDHLTAFRLLATCIF